MCLLFMIVYEGFKWQHALQERLCKTESMAANIMVGP